MEVIGLVVLAVVAIIIISLRTKIEQSDNKMLKTAQKVGDFFSVIRFIFFIIFAIFIVFIFSVVGKGSG